MVTHYIGEDKLYWVQTLDDLGNPITAVDVVAQLYNSDGIKLYDIDVTKAKGKVTGIVAGSAITEPGRYYITWKVSWSPTQGKTATKILITEIVASKRDSTSLISLVPRLRVWVNDNPDDVNNAMHSDAYWKRFIVEAIRMHMRNYSIVIDKNGHEDVSPALSGNDETLAVLWGAYLYWTLSAEAIAREQTAMYSISYDSAYSTIKNRIEMLQDAIMELDPSSAMVFEGETDIEAWGNVTKRLSTIMSNWGQEGGD